MKPAYDVARVMDNMGWLGELVDMMNELGWDVCEYRRLACPVLFQVARLRQ